MKTYILFQDLVNKLNKKRCSMKVSKIIVLLLSVIIFTGCFGKVGGNGRDANDSSLVDMESIRDTVYINNDPVVPEYIYLNIDSLSLGDPFTDRIGNYGFYRLVFSSSEETQSFHIEKIDIVGEGILKLDKRFTIPYDKLGLDFVNPRIGLIEWVSPEVIVLVVNDKKVKLDLTKMKVLEMNDEND